MLQTYTRLQKLNLTVSHPSLIRLLKKVGSTFDEKATKWRDDLLNLLRTSETSVSLLLQYGGCWIEMHSHTHTHTHSHVM